LNAKFHEFLARLPGRAPAALAEMVKKADAVSSQLTALFGAMDEKTRREGLDLIAEEVVHRSTPPENAVGPDGRPTPELMEWARRTFDVDAHLAGVRGIERTGGVELKDIIHELEQ
jgi:hypothetical protein